MCARRFLIFVFILILIAVAGAFALFQFGDQVLIQQATPQGHYQEPPKVSGPDYSSDASWLAKPGLSGDPSGWVPDGVVTSKTAEPAATFYIHPTTYLERDRWNAPLNAGGEVDSRTRLFVQSQASAFNAVSDIWAPRYRQAAFGAFLLKNEDATKALELAYQDVLAAFDAFLAAQPADKPIILAGHSQGSLHLSRLLIDRKDALKGRLVAAYVAGWPLSVTADLPATGLEPCASADQIGCVMNWQSFKEPANFRLILDAWKGTAGPTGIDRNQADMVCVNPLTGTAGGSAPSTANLGTLVPNGDFVNAALAVGKVGAICEKGFLMIDGDLPQPRALCAPGQQLPRL